MAGYSGTPLLRKLGVKEEFRVLLRHAPEGFGKTLGRLPSGAKLLSRASRFDVAVLFSKSRTALAAEFPKLVRQMETAGMLWVGWPKGGRLFFTHYSFLGFDPRPYRDPLSTEYIMQYLTEQAPNRLDGGAVETWAEIVRQVANPGAGSMTAGVESDSLEGIL